MADGGLFGSMNERPGVGDVQIDQGQAVPAPAPENSSSGWGQIGSALMQGLGDTIASIPQMANYAPAMIAGARHGVVPAMQMKQQIDQELKTKAFNQAMSEISPDGNVSSAAQLQQMLAVARKHRPDLVIPLLEMIQRGELQEQQLMGDLAVAGAKAGEAKSKEQLKQEKDLRGEFMKDYGRPFLEARTNLDKILAATPNAAGDVSLIFSYMKMLDPTSVVREGEQATARNAAGVVDQVRNLYNRALTGVSLTETQRKQFKSEGLNIFESSYVPRLQQGREVFSRYAEGAEARPGMIMPGLYDPERYSQFAYESVPDDPVPEVPAGTTSDDIQAQIQAERAALRAEGWTDAEIDAALAELD